MNISKKLIIDMEKENEAISFCNNNISKDGEKIDIILAGKIIIPVPENERCNKIYRLLEETCDVIFCTTQSLKDFHFYPIPRFSIFAVDSCGNSFGTIGGIGDLTDDKYPVGYVEHSDIYFKLANSLKEFLELVVFYPFWKEIIKCKQMGLPYNIKVIEEEYIKSNSEFILHQCEIASILHLTKNPNAIQTLISNIDCKQDLVVYSSKEDAQKENSFFDVLG